MFVDGAGAQQFVVQAHSTRKMKMTRWQSLN